jgi:glycosyltransferase involved in cell wall biosynthesis
MRLLYVADTRFPLERANGIQTFETCHALARACHRVRLVVRADTHVPPRDPFAFYGAPALDAFEVVGLDLRGPAVWRRAAFLAASLEFTSRRDIDLVFTRDLGVAATLLRLPRALRPPVIYESHGVSATVGAQLGQYLSTGTGASGAKQRRLARRERSVWRTADGYVTITSALARELSALYGPRPVLAVVPDGARLPASRPFVPTPPGPFVACYSGHLYPWKGVDVLVRALALTAGIAGLVVGGHPAEPDLARVRALVADLGLEPRVRFTGLVAPSSVPPLLLQAHALVLPNSATAISSAYSSPLKLFEYLAAGRPVVASDLPAFREVLDHEVTALLVPPDDPSALARALERLRDDPALVDRLGRAAHALAGGYSWDARARRIGAIAEEVLADRARE